MKKIITIIGICIGAMMGAEMSNWFNSSMAWSNSGHLFLQHSSTYYMSVAVGAFIGWMVATIFAKPLMQLIEKWLEQTEGMPLRHILAAIGGLCIGLLIAAAIYPALSLLGGLWRYTPVAIALLCGYVGLQLGVKKQDELAVVMKQLLEKQKVVASQGEVKGYEEHKILDTSVIIDGRIADICKTGFIEGTLVIPEFVLEELQHIADSSDLLKRNRGRRGLDILNKIQKELDVHVLIYEGDFEDISEVDSKLVKLAKVLSGKVVTNDFNLNKVCELQGVSVLNINDLANAVKPVVLPGEEIVVQVIKDGKEHGQGVAYLDDGTMIVVEGGREYIGHTMEVLVTSVLQTSAGRMIFAKPKLLEKAL